MATVPSRTPEAPLAASRPVARATLLILFGLAVVSNLDRQILAIVIGPIKAALHISDLQVSIAQGSAFSLLFVLVGLPFGYAADRLSRRATIFVGVAIWAAAAVGSGLARTYAALLAARFFVGVGEAALLPCAYSMLADLFPKRQLARALSLFSTGHVLGNALALILGGIVLQWAAMGGRLPGLPGLAPWQTTFVAAGLPAAGLALLIFAIPEPRRTSAPASKVDERHLARFLRANAKLLALYCAGFTLLTALILGQVSWMVPALMRSYAWTPREAGVRIGLFLAATGITGQVFNGVIVDRWFRTKADAHLRYFVIVLPPAVLAVCAGAWASNGWAYLLSLAPANIFLNFTGVGAAGLQAITPPELRGRVSAIYLMVQGTFAISIGTLLPAVMTDLVFRRPDALRYALVVSSVVLGALVWTLFRLGMSPMRAQVKALA